MTIDRENTKLTDSLPWDYTPQHGALEDGMPVIRMADRAAQQNQGP
jgi:hypothetical protein